MTYRRKYPDPSKGDTDMMTLVLNVDPDWPTRAYYPVQYRFQNGRVFGEPQYPGEAYDWRD